jgi:hypothetical protein
MTAAKGPYGLRPQTQPRVRPEWGRVVVTLELVSLTEPLDIFDCELVFPKEYAEQLGLSLSEAALKLA